MRGFSLLEIMLAASVAGVIGILLISILVNTSGFFYQQQSVINEGLSLNDVLGQISSLVKGAQSVANNYPETGTPQFTTSSTILVLKLPGINQNEVLPDVSDFVVVTKDPQNLKILTLKIFPDPRSTRELKDSVLTTLLDAIKFSYLDKTGSEVLTPNLAETVRIDLTVLAKTGSIGSKRSAGITVNLRNVK